jgi:hypothetical protein
MSAFYQDRSVLFYRQIAPLLQQGYDQSMVPLSHLALCLFFGGFKLTKNDCCDMSLRL